MFALRAEQFSSSRNLRLTSDGVESYSERGNEDRIKNERKTKVKALCNTMSSPVFYSIMPNLTARKLAYKTGTFNSLYEVSLAEQVYDNQRSYNHKSCGILEYVLIESGSCCTLRRLD